jgi:hypothetical protein
MTNLVVESSVLDQFKQRFEEIKNSKSDNYIKNVRFAALMTDMEGVCRIPMFGADRIAAFKRAYPEEMKLYREVSLARDFQGGE